LAFVQPLVQLFGALDTTPARTVVPYVYMDFFYSFDRANILQAV